MTDCIDLINVLGEDPGLARHLHAAQAESATRRALARVVSVPKGIFAAPDMFPAACGTLGLLVVDGLLLRGVSALARPSLEVLGPGDVFRPFEQQRDPYASVASEDHWWALRPARLAVLDASFTRGMADYPEVVGELANRLWRRSTASSLRLAIIQEPCLSTRLQLMLWHLADRFGQTEADGLILPLPLCHTLLSWLVCARRPAVSRTLKELERDQLVVCQPDATWRLTGQPPQGLTKPTALAQPVAA